MLETYELRDKLLKKLGYPSYQEYLCSERWWKIKEKVLVAYENRCILCSSKATEVHHLSYRAKVLMGKKMDQLVPLCRSCHVKVEFHPDGKKRMLAQAQKVYESLWAEVKKGMVQSGTPEIVVGRCKLCNNPARTGSAYCRPCALKAGKVGVKKVCKGKPWIGLRHKRLAQLRKRRRP